MREPPQGEWGFRDPVGHQIPTHPDERVARRAAEQHGRISLEQLRECGLTSKAIWVRKRQDRLHPVHEGVYAVGHESWNLYAHFMAAVLACGPGAVLSHFAAAVLWGFMRWQWRDVDVIVLGDKGRDQDGLRPHRMRLHEDDVRRHHGIPATTAARTCLDLAAELPPRALRRAVRQAQAEQWASVRQIADVLARNTGQRGSRRLADLIATPRTDSK